MSGGHLPHAPLAVYTKILASRYRYFVPAGGFSLGGQAIDPSAFPAKGAGLGKAQMGQHAISEFAGHLI